jgi:acylphosphatase
MNDKCISIIIKGRVQGVGFRYHTLNAANMFGIKGWVKNMPDGTVYIEAFAPEKNMDQFIDWCKKGPPLSRVIEILVNDLPCQEYNSFSIR